MDKKEKLDHLKFIIGRYDHYYESVNNKGNIYLTLGTFLLGGSVAWFFPTVKAGGWSCSLIILMGLCIIVNLLTIGTVLFALKPYLSKPKENESGSLIFFGDVGCYPYSVYQKLFDDLDEGKNYNDLVKQSHLLSAGLRNKFLMISWATYFLASVVLLLVIIGFITLNK